MGLDGLQILKQVYDSTNKALRVELKLPVCSAAPSSPEAGDCVIADRTNWDPLSIGSGGSYAVWYNGAAWRPLGDQ